jgi:hypothetical protein
MAARGEGRLGSDGKVAWVREGRGEEGKVAREQPYPTAELLRRIAEGKKRWSGVAEPPELFWFKCASHRYTADTNSTHFKRNNPLVCRVSARCNHGSTGSKQVYLARRRVYSRTTAHQLLIHRELNIITTHFKLK